LAFIEPDGSLLCSQELTPYYSLFWARWIQSTHSHPICFYCNISNDIMQKKLNNSLFLLIGSEVSWEETELITEDEEVQGNFWALLMGWRGLGTLFL